MAQPDTVPRIQDSTKLAKAAMRADKEDRCVLLQVGSEPCERCPAFSKVVAELAEVYAFDW